jgi:hypothetical protein
MRRTVNFQITLVAVLALILFLPVISANAQKQSLQIATIDLATLLALHPSMVHYDPNSRAFKVTRPRQQFVQDKARVAGERATKIADYRARVKALETQLSSERSKYIREEAEKKGEFDKSVAKLDPEAIRLHLQAFRNKEAEAQQKHVVKMRSLQLQIAQLNRQIENENAEMISDRFTTPAETKQRFLEILAEVRQHAQTVAAAKNISIVLDSGGASFQQLDSFANASPLSAEVDYSGVFAAPMLSPITLSSDEASVQGYYNLRRDRALVWHNHRAQILAPFRNELANTSVLVGGIDITVEVLNSVLKQHRVDQTVQSILNSVVQGGR